MRRKSSKRSNRTSARSEFRTSRAANTVHFFEQPLSIKSAPAGFCDAEFEEAEDGSIIKKALLMVEGEHVDSQKRRHVFDAQRIYKIAKNTNNFLSRHGRIPWQKDHNKTQDSNIGDLEGMVEARVITKEDLPDPRLKDLVGKVGIFTSNLVAKGRDVVDQILSGRIKTLSPGIDINSDIIREVSATPTPAIVGLMTFKRGADRSANFALTMDEAEADMADMDAVKAECHDLTDLFLNVFESIQNATEDELQGTDPVELQNQAIDDLIARLQVALGLDQVDPTDPTVADPTGMTPQQLAVSPMPGYTQRQQGVQMSRDIPVAAFSIADMEQLVYGVAEFRRRRNKTRDRVVGRTNAGKLTRAAGVLGVGGLAAAGIMNRRKIGSMIAQRTKGPLLISPYRRALIPSSAESLRGKGRIVATGQQRVRRETVNASRASVGERVRSKVRDTVRNTKRGVRSTVARAKQRARSKSYPMS
ncbi:MAG TPA: hypothetical protein V6C65_04285 [Allocoleopsis sp.]